MTSRLTAGFSFPATATRNVIGALAVHRKVMPDYDIIGTDASLAANGVAPCTV